MSKHSIQQDETILLHGGQVPDPTTGPGQCLSIKLLLTYSGTRSMHRIYSGWQSREIYTHEL